MGSKACSVNIYVLKSKTITYDTTNKLEKTLNESSSGNEVWNLNAVDDHSQQKKSKRRKNKKWFIREKNKVQYLAHWMKGVFREQN